MLPFPQQPQMMPNGYAGRFTPPQGPWPQPIGPVAPIGDPRMPQPGPGGISPIQSPIADPRFGGPGPWGGQPPIGNPLQWQPQPLQVAPQPGAIPAQQPQPNNFSALSNMRRPVMM